MWVTSAMKLPLSQIRAFEAAARNGSFRAAAAELYVSPSAISHAVQKLEEALGTSLFDRHGRSIRLNTTGSSLVRHVEAAFDEIRTGVELVSQRRPRLLRVHCAPSFAAKWLLPHLNNFLGRHPDIELRVASSAETVDLERDEFDIDIRYGSDPTRGVVSIPLAIETVMPLCSPRLAAAIAAPANLLSLPLIQSEAKSVGWSDWFAANGVTEAATFGLRFDRSFLAVAAAASGLGVALESDLLGAAELRSGVLVAPLAGIATNLACVGHYLTYRGTGSKRRLVQLFVGWILNSLRGDEPMTPDADERAVGAEAAQLRATARADASVPADRFGSDRYSGDAPARRKSSRP